MEHTSTLWKTFINRYDLKNVFCGLINVGNYRIILEIHNACLHMKGSEDLRNKEILLNAFNQLFFKHI